MVGDKNFKLIKGYEEGEGELLKQKDIHCRERELIWPGEKFANKYELKGVKDYLFGGLKFLNGFNLLL
ncbi:MAG: hypothetical protein GTN76_06070 [Candidatus Aenigmarchaeota archaeon]|nr:hypothetical protein [Candidatus Aenigmarchaeota archaeon]